MGNVGPSPNPRLGGPAEGALHAEGVPGAGASRSMGLDEEDACDVLASLTRSGLVGRLVSEQTGEWMCVFKPSVAGVVVYMKVVVRAHCVVISFHEEEETDEDD